jgi:hypothetical protein
VIGRGITIAGAVLLALTGCTSAAPPSGAYPLIRITHPHAQLTCPDVPAFAFDADPAEVTAVHRCTADFHEVEGVLNKVQYVEVLEDDPAALLAAYGAPDEPASAEGCDAVQADPLILWLTVDDGIVAVRAPVDGCGAPQPGAAAAYAAADFDRILVAREVASTLAGG